MTDPAVPTPPVRGVDYKGEPLDSDRGPGLGCFRIQIAVLAIAVVLTPLSVAWDWPIWISSVLLVIVLVLLLFAGQTIIFLLRLVAADRRAAGRRRPLAPRTPTVGQLEDAAAPEPGDSGPPPADPPDEGRVPQ